VREIGIDEHDALARIRDEGVLLSQTRPGVIRAVTHLDIGDDDVERALAAVPRALGSVVRA
jgi:threonine aldolase